MKLAKNQKGFGAVEALLLILIVLVASFAGYYVAHNHTQSKPVASASTSASKQSATSTTADPYAGWQTYTDTIAGYSIKIPKDWEYVKSHTQKLADGTVDTDYQGNPLMTPDAIRPTGESDASVDGIWTVLTDTSSLSPKDYFVQNGAGRANYVDGEGTTSTINGYADFSASMTGETTTKVVTISHAGKIVEFAYYTSEANNKHVSDCDQIVSTIKFL